jgi:hypothetical protein
MKIYSRFVGSLTAGCLLGLAAAPRASAEVTDEQFNQLKDLVNQQGQDLKQQNQRLQDLEKTHEQDVKTHEQDQQKIRELQQQLGETQSIATNAAQKAEQAAQVQPVSRAVVAGPAPSHNFTMVGDAEVQFGKFESQHSGFALADFAPIFLFRGGDNVLFEAGFDFILQNNAPDSSGYTTTVNLSFATLDYLYNDYVTFVGGNMILPLGTYNERGAGWLNKIPDAPMPRSILQGNGVGIQFRGALPIGDSGDMFTYAVYGCNGPGSTQTNTIALQNNIDLTSGNVTFPNMHADPSGGGRLGWFHNWKAHTDLELGISGQTGQWDNEGNHLWSAVVFDAALHISPYFEAKGEYANTWQGTDDLGDIHAHGWWVQASYKLAGLNFDFPLVNDLELISRFDSLNDGLGTTTDRVTAGFVYYFSNTLLLETDYEFVRSGGPAGKAVTPGLIAQLSYGF